MSYRLNHGTNNPADGMEPEYSRSVMTILPASKAKQDSDVLDSRNNMFDEGEIKMNEELLQSDSTSTINTLTKSDAIQSALLDSTHPPRHPCYYQPVITDTTSDHEYSHSELQPQQAVSQHHKLCTQTCTKDVRETDLICSSTLPTSLLSSTLIAETLPLQLSNQQHGNVGIKADMDLSSGDLSSTSILQKRQMHHPEAVSSISKPEKVQSRRSLKLLVVDDSGLNRKMMRRLLEAQGYNCEEAADGQIAVDMVKSTMTDTHSTEPNNDKRGGDSDNNDRASLLTTHIATFDHYDAILMDFIMPVMNGPTATSEIRKLGYTGPIIGVTGNALDADKELFIAAGASHVFTKPLDVSFITKALQGTCSRLRMYQ